MDIGTSGRKGRFTGWHMTAILVTFFGVVIAVNLTMAYLAVRGFGGTVVDNSYVASQNYNRWLAEGRAQQALGWTVEAIRAADGRALVTVTSTGGRWDGRIDGTARRVMGRSEEQPVAFVARADGRFESTEPVVAGRVRLRLTLLRGDQGMRVLADLP